MGNCKSSSVNDGTALHSEQIAQRGAALLENFRKSNIAALVDLHLKPIAQKTGSRYLTIEDANGFQLQAPRVTGSQRIDLSMATYMTWVDRVFNKDVLGLPYVIVRVKAPEDIAACITLAKEIGCPLSVASGCHSMRSMVDGAVVVDFGDLRGCHYDAETQTLHCESGALIEDHDAELSKNKMVVPTGTNPFTGIAGLTLAGGAGWYSRRFGLSIDNLVSVDGVLVSSGEYIHATDVNEYAELLWASRGGGGNFGLIIMKFVYRCHAVPHNGKVLNGTIVPMCPTVGAKKDCIFAWWQAVASLDQDTASVLVMPCGAPVTPSMWAHLGPTALAGVSVIPELATLSKKTAGWFTVKNHWEVIDYYTDLQKKLVPKQPEGYYYQSVAYFDTLNENLAATLAHFTTKDIPNKISALLMFPFLDRAKEPHPKAFLNERPGMWLLIEGRWDPDSAGLDRGREALKAWTRRLNQALRESGARFRTTTHAFANSDDRDRDRAEANANWQKLKEVARKYDPDALLLENWLDRSNAS